MCCALLNLVRLNLAWIVYRDGLERQRTTETSSRYSNCRIQCSLRVYILGSVAMSGLVIVRRPCKLWCHSLRGHKLCTTITAPSILALSLIPLIEIHVLAIQKDL